MFTPPSQPLPLPPNFSTPAEYIPSLLRLTQTPLFQTLCGGVHILDFFTRDPPNDIYTTIIPFEWREYFNQLSIDDVLDVLMRRDLIHSEDDDDDNDDDEKEGGGRDADPDADANGDRDRDGSIGGETNIKKKKKEPKIPQSLKEFILDVRGHTLNRDFNPRWAGSKEEVSVAKKLRKQRKKGEVLEEEEEVLSILTVGMKPKKMHEVENFAHLLHHLLTPSTTTTATAKLTTTNRCEATSNDQSSPSSTITHIADIGSGQGYLLRLLSSPSYGYSVIGIESKQSNIQGALDIDRLVRTREEKWLKRKTKSNSNKNGIRENLDNEFDPEKWRNAKGNVQYVEKFITDGGDLQDVVDKAERGDVDAEEGKDIQDEKKEKDVGILLTSLHSCGDLVHHALNSLVSVPSIKAVALIGCCYNLMSEKFTEQSYKPPYLPPSCPCTLSPSPSPSPSPNLTPSHPTLPPLRNPHPRLLSTLPTPATPHPHGFPLSTYLTNHQPPPQLNITARSMACQAPQNWTKETSSSFFTRHFYRALLQRIFVDAGIVSKLGVDGKGEPIILGTLRAPAYTSWVRYVRAAVGKLGLEAELRALKCSVPLPTPPPPPTRSANGNNSTEEDQGEETPLDEILTAYESYYRQQPTTSPVPTRPINGFHSLATTWSLMAFCAGVVESLIVVDRWLWLHEHTDEGRAQMGETGIHEDRLEIDNCWVEAGFEYEYSPRNLVVVGVKKGVCV